jgi:L-asparaginase
MRNRILMMATGGTIASEYDPAQNRVVTRLSGEELLRRLGPGYDNMDIDVETLEIMPSCHITPQKVLEWSRLIRERAETGQYAGLVLTQGTDTMEESAFLMDLLLDVNIPVVLTGAMKSHQERYVDALGNLNAAIRAAAHPAAADYGVLVVMSGEIHTAKHVRKTDSESINAFSSPGAGPVGRVYGNQVRFFRHVKKSAPFNVERLDKRVELIHTAMGMDGRLLDALLEQGVDGIVVAAMGIGNIPPKLARSVERAVDRGIPVVLCTRAVMGPSLPIYDYEGGGYQLAQKGVIFAGEWPALKARLLLLCMLSAGMNREEMLSGFNAFSE